MYVVIAYKTHALTSLKQVQYPSFPLFITCAYFRIAEQVQSPQYCKASFGQEHIEARCLLKPLRPRADQTSNLTKCLGIRILSLRGIGSTNDGSTAKKNPDFR